MSTKTIIDLPPIDEALVFKAALTPDEDRTYWVSVFVTDALREELIRLNTEVGVMAMVKKLINIPQINKLLTVEEHVTVYVSTTSTKHLNDGMDYVALESFMFNDTWKIKVDLEKYKEVHFLNIGENDE